MINTDRHRNGKIDDLCIAMIKEHLELSITEVDIEHTCWIGKLRDTGQKSRPKITKFLRNNYSEKCNRKKKQKERILQLQGASIK